MRKRVISSVLLFIFLFTNIMPISILAAKEDNASNIDLNNYISENKSSLDYALFSSTTEAPLSINCANINIEGNVHTNNNFEYRGSGLIIDGKCESSGIIDVKDKKAKILNKVEKASIIKMPELLSEIKTISEENSVMYDSSQNFKGSEVSFTNSIIVNGDLSVNGSRFNSTGYIIANGDIKFNSAKIDNETAIVLCSENGNIDINSSNVKMKGIIYAPKGTVTVNAADFTLKGRIIANRIIFKGSKYKISSSEEDFDLIYEERDVIFELIESEYNCSEQNDITFAVVDKIGKPVPNLECFINTTGSATTTSSVITDSDGKATINISDEVEESVILTISTQKGLSKSVNISFLKKQPKVELYFLDNDNSPLSGVQITVFTLNGMYEKYSSSENGQIKFNLPVGEYTFKIEKDNYKSIEYENISLATGSVFIDTIILHELLNEIAVQFNTIVTNQSVNNRINVKVLYDKDQLIGESDDLLSAVELLAMNTSGEWVSKGFFFDNGNLYDNGDEIKGDQVYTNIFDFYEVEQRKLNLKVVVYKYDETQVSKEFEIEVVDPLPDEAFQQVIEINNNIRNFADNCLIGNDNITTDELKNLVKNELNKDDRVKEVKMVNDTIEIILTSGLKSYVQIANDNDAETMVRGSGTTLSSEYDFDIESYNGDYDITLSKDILLWAPFDSEWGESDETEYIEEIVVYHHIVPN